MYQAGDDVCYAAARTANPEEVDCYEEVGGEYMDRNIETCE